ncbi:hypothetical protein KKB99_00490, partial [bacterium]|nr:hypothetical protein [bacterium]MBU1024463.1 hypothetical protein [bacterium]
FIGRFLSQVAENRIVDSWYERWRVIPMEVKAAALCIYIFFDALAIILFFNYTWDVNQLLILFDNLNVKALVFIFALSQIALFPFIMWVWRKKERSGKAPFNRITLLLLLLIFFSGLLVIHPMYRPDTDFLKAAKSVSDNLDKNASIVFSGKKDDSNPFMFYSVQRHGWSYNLIAFHSTGWEELKKYKNDGAEYLAVMKKNRCLASDHPMSKEIISYLEQLNIYHEDPYITIYILDNIP